MVAKTAGSNHNAPLAKSERLQAGEDSSLTEREQELLAHLAHGADTREVAQVMSLSSHTIQDHLKSVSSKTGTSSRRTLIAHALGVQG